MKNIFLFLYENYLPKSKKNERWHYFAFHKLYLMDNRLDSHPYLYIQSTLIPHISVGSGKLYYVVVKEWEGEKSNILMLLWK